MNCSRIRMLEAQKDFCNSRGDYFSWLKGCLGMQVPRRLESILKKERHNSKRMWVIVSIGLGIVNGSGKIPKKECVDCHRYWCMPCIQRNMADRQSVQPARVCEVWEKKKK